MKEKQNSIKRRGRPVAAADSDMRELLLDTATALFAEQGVAATSISEIAARAGVTSAMIHYYFKTRDRLLDAVVKERLGRFVAIVDKGISEGSGEAQAMIRELVKRIISATEEMPWLPPLWIREIASDGGQLRERLLQLLPPELQQRFGACVAAGQEKGTVNPDIHPQLLFVSVIGLTLFPLAVAKIWQRLPTLKELGRQGVADHATALLLYGLVGAKQKHYGLCTK